jgi:hypothetical protein
MTYAAAGELFGISADAVRMRVKRLHLRTQPGNDGRTLVWIEGTDGRTSSLDPPEQREQEGEQKGEQGERTPHGLLAQAVTALESSVLLLGEQLAEAKARAARTEVALADEQAKGNRLQADLAAARDDLTLSHAAIDQAQTAAAGASKRAEVAAAEAEQLRQAETERKGRGRWARLRAAWRGE